MPAPNANSRAAAAAVVAGIVVSIGLGALVVNAPAQGRRHVKIDQGHAGPGFRCLTGTAYAPPEVLPAFRLDSVGQHEYCRFRVCYPPGQGAAAQLPAGVVAIEAGEVESDWAGGHVDFEAWCEGDTDDPSPCACGPGCEWRRNAGAPWEPSIGNVYQAGMWRAIPDGGTCVRTSCTYVAGLPGLPEACQ